MNVVLNLNVCRVFIWDLTDRLANIYSYAYINGFIFEPEFECERGSET